MKNKININQLCMALIILIIILGNCAYAIHSAEEYGLIKFIQEKYYSEVYGATTYKLNENIDIFKVKEIIDESNIIHGYVYPYSVMYSEYNQGNKNGISLTIMKCGEWIDNNTYEVTEGKDIEYNGEEVIPLVVGGYIWNNVEIGEEIKISLTKSNGEVIQHRGKIVGKMNQMKYIVGLQYKELEAYRSIIILPDLGLEKYVDNANVIAIVYDWYLSDENQIIDIEERIKEISQPFQYELSYDISYNYLVFVKYYGKDENKNIPLLIIIQVLSGIFTFIIANKNKKWFFNSLYIVTYILIITLFSVVKYFNSEYVYNTSNNFIKIIILSILTCVFINAILIAIGIFIKRSHDKVLRSSNFEKLI